MRIALSPSSSGHSSPLLPSSPASSRSSRESYSEKGAPSVWAAYLTPPVVRGLKLAAVVLALSGVFLLAVSSGSPPAPVLSEASAAPELHAGSSGDCTEGELSLVVRGVGRGRSSHSVNTLSPAPFHPQLSATRASLFTSPNSTRPNGDCLVPTHSLPLAPPTAVRPGSSNLFFAYCTTPSRVIQFAPVWNHFLSSPPPSPLWYADDPPSRPPGCLVVDAKGQGDKQLGAANKALKEAGTGCVMRDSSRAGERYEMRVLGLIKDAWEESEARRFDEGRDAVLVEWFVFGDDDTWWLSQEAIRDLVSQYDWREDNFLGGFSEAEGNFATFGRIAYGGAGMILSRSLIRKMQPLLEQCADRYASTIFGGDGLVSNCAALATGKKVDKMITEIPGLSQMDLRGDSSGYLSSGEPFLSLHHWVGWLDLIPGRAGITAISLLRLGVEAVNSRNLLQRYIFDGGHISWSIGYSVIVFRDALTEDDLTRVEHTWRDFQPRRKSRGERIEGEEKFTYYVTTVREDAQGRTVFEHECDHPALEGGLRKINIIWDPSLPATPLARPEQPSTLTSMRSRLAGIFSQAWASLLGESVVPQKRARRKMIRTSSEGGAISLGQGRWINA